MKRRLYLIPLLLLGILLVASGSYGTANATLSIRSNPYVTRIETEGVSTALMETDINGNTSIRQGEGNLLKDLSALNNDGKFKIGQNYDRRMYVYNNGKTSEYVRTTIYRYWTDKNGRRVDLDPSLISLETSEKDGWHIDQELSGTERIIMWYDKLLNAGETTPAFTGNFSLNPNVASLFTKYGNIHFHIEVVVDAIQEHNVEEAMHGAWGCKYDVAISEGSENNEGLD